MSRTLPAIVSLADVAAVSGVTTDAELARLTLVWRAVEAEVRRFCGHNLIQPADPYVDFLPQRDEHLPLDPLLQNDYAWESRYAYIPGGGPQVDGHLLPLRQGLVRSISEIRIDLSSRGGTDAGDFGSDTILDPSAYYLDVEERDPSGLLISWTSTVVRKTGTWPTRRRSIKVTYVAGLTAEELDTEFSDVRLAVIEEILDRYAGLNAEGAQKIKSERLGDWSVQYALPENAGRLSQNLKDVLYPFVRYRL